MFFSVFECDHQPLDVETEHQAVEENEPQYVIAHDTAEQVESDEKDAIPDGRFGGHFRFGCHFGICGGCRLGVLGEVGKTAGLP